MRADRKPLLARSVIQSVSFSGFHQWPYPEAHWDHSILAPRVEDVVVAAVHSTVQASLVLPY